MNFKNRLKTKPIKAGLVTFAATAGAATAALLLLFSGAPVFAVERLPGVVDRPPVELPAEVKRPVEIKPEKMPEVTPFDTGTAGSVKINEVIFSGDLVFSESVLQGIAKPFIKKPVSPDDITRLKYALLKRYYDKGYVLVKVTTPPQNISSGTLKIIVYAGKIGNIETQNNRLRKYLVRSHFTNRLKKGEVFNERRVETAVKNVDDLGRLKANLNLKPGETFGTTDLLLVTEKERDQFFEITADNYGSRLTGKAQLAANLRLSNFLKFGESISGTYRWSEEGLQSYSSEASLPIGIGNLRLEGNYLYSENDIEGRLAALDAAGITRKAGAAISGKFTNSSKRQILMRVGGEIRRHESFLGGMLETRDDITRAYVEGSILTRYRPLVIYLDGIVSKGFDALGSDIQGEADASTMMGHPKAWRFNGRAYASLAFTRSTYFSVNAQGQLASTHLLASDQFSLGGYGSVRGFRVAKESGEEGVQITTELSQSFSLHPNARVSIIPFFDYGAVKSRTAGMVVDDKLYSLGVGAEVVMKLFRHTNTTARFDWGRPIRRKTYKDRTVDHNIFYIRVTQNY
ncbi:MAG: ShlB/FhaC/HecB family hemolysin secretion/activation protein [Thermodesulfobacteriota bacterium]